MKKLEKDAIDALHNMLMIPLPAAGNQSASAQGFIDYGSEMLRLVPIARQLMATIKVGESYEGHLRGKIQELNAEIERIAAL